ncbi:hypothetical protein QFC22_005475, partial [Naganishia vaughanmartiniae]
MSPSVLSASPSPSIGNTALAPYYTHPSSAFPTSLIASSTGPMLSGLHPPPRRLKSVFETEALSPLSSVATEHAKSFSTFTNGTGMSADEEEEDHFDDYVQGDLGYDDDGEDGSQFGPDVDGDAGSRNEPENIISRALGVNNNMYNATFGGTIHMAMQAGRRDRQRISPTSSPISSFSRDRDPTEDSGPRRQESPSAAAHHTELHGQYSTNVSPAPPLTSVQLTEADNVAVTTADQILNPASYEGMNTRSYGLTILADGSNGSRAFMNPLTGTAREPHSSGSGAATPTDSVPGYSGAGGFRNPLGAYAHYGRSGTAGIEQRGGSIDPGSLRSSPFHPPSSRILSPRSHLHYHSQKHSRQLAPETGDSHSIVTGRSGPVSPHMHSLHSQSHPVANTSYGRMVESFPPNVNRRTNESDFEMDEHVFPEAGIPVHPTPFNYGDDASIPSPVDTLSSEYGSGELVHPASDPQEHGLTLGIDSRNSLQPDDDADEEPLYVNAKQYHRILTRRAARARLEELNQLIRQRK